MRSRNFRNLKDTYGKFNKQHMLRVALIEGLKPKYPLKERLKYKELVKRYSGLEKKKRIDTLFSLLETTMLSSKQKEFLDDILVQVDYKNGLWKKFDDNHLKKENVLLENNKSIDNLLFNLFAIHENKVIETNTKVMKKGVDYLKHVSPTRKIVLNSKDVITVFAKERNFNLPENYLKNGRMTEEVMQLLEQYDFNFNKAIQSAVTLLRQDKYRKRDISLLSIKRRNGDEIRLFPYDIMAGTELYYEIMKYRPKIKMRHGKVTDKEFKYHGTNIFDVPRRNPTGDKQMDKVETTYLPNLDKLKYRILEWMNTIAICDCDHALNTRNFEIRRKRMARQAKTFDVHARVVLLYVTDQRQVGRFHIIYPTESYIKFVDKMRYNLAYKNKFIGNLGINRLICESFKLFSFEEMFTTNPPEENKVLRNLYLER